IDLSSDEFDTFLLAGPMPASGCSNENDALLAMQYNDDFGGSSNSRLTLAVANSGPQLVVVSSYGGDEAGGYTLSVQLGTPPAPAPEPTPIAFGSPVQGELTDSDYVEPFGSYADCYVFTVTGPQRLQVDMMSTDFDAYFELGLRSA